VCEAQRLVRRKQSARDCDIIFDVGDERWKGFEFLLDAEEAEQHQRHVTSIERVGKGVKYVGLYKALRYVAKSRIDAEIHDSLKAGIRKTQTR